MKAMAKQQDDGIQYSERGATVPVMIRVTESENDFLTRQAQQEKRSKAAMARILVSEAIRARTSDATAANA